jgi:DHA2 family multidrug resistance protein
MGYSALDSGLAVSPRGVGAVASMILAGILVNYVDGRILLAFGLGIMGYSTYMLGQLNLGISIGSVVLPNMLNGFAGGFIFVPLTTMTMSRLRKQEIGNAAGIYNLMRNIGGSIGIACVTTMLVRGAQAHQNYLAANLTPSTAGLAGMVLGLQGRFRLQGASAATAHQEALGALYRSIQQQAALLAYTDNFRLLAYLSMLCIPLAALFYKVHKQSRGHDIAGE